MNERRWTPHCACGAVLAVAVIFTVLPARGAAMAVVGGETTSNAMRSRAQLLVAERTSA